MVLFSIQHFGKSTGVKHTVLLDGQPPTVAFTVLTQMCGPKANETEIGTSIFIKNGDGRTLTLNFDVNEPFSIKM